MKAVLEAGGIKILLLCLLVNANMHGCEKMPFLVTGESERPGYSKHMKPLLFMQYLTCLRKENGSRTPENTVFRPVCITAP
jgi:hypothetical protein